MGTVVHDAFSQLKDHGYAPQYPAINPDAITSMAKAGKPLQGVSINDLIEAELLPPGTTLTPAKDAAEGVVAAVLPDGKIVYNDEVHSSPSGAAVGVTSVPVNGWVFWAADTADGRFTLAALREIFLERHS